MSSQLTSLVPVLDGSNYGVWQTSMKAFLMSQGMWGHITGVAGFPLAVFDADDNQTNAPQQEEWLKRDDMVHGHLVLRTSISIQQELSSLTDPSARDIWEHLLNRYGVATPSSVYKDF